MKALITGGLGFLGQHLTRRLKGDGHDVSVLGVKDNSGDVRDYESVKSAIRGVDTVFHLAAVVGVEQASANPIDVMDTELIGIRNLVRASVEKGVKRIVYASSSEIYGNRALLPMSESDSPSPLSSYGVSKLAVEHYLKAFGDKIESVSLRIFNAYGPGQDERFVVARFINQALKNEQITVYDDGRQTRDFTYIDDVVEAFVLASGTKYLGEVFNVATGIQTRVISLAKIVKSATRSDSKIVLVRPSKRLPEFEVRKRTASLLNSRKKLGFEAKTVLRDGIVKTITLRTRA